MSAEVCWFCAAGSGLLFIVYCLADTNLKLKKKKKISLNNREEAETDAVWVQTFCPSATVLVNDD